VGAPFVAFASAAPGPVLIATLGALFNVAFVRHGVGFHYECALLPFLFAALAAGLARWSRAAPAGATGLTPWRLAAVTLSFLLFFGRSPVDTLREMVPDAHDRAVSATLAALPRQASVATHAALYPHVTHRTRALLLPAGLRDAEYVAVDRSEELSRYDTPDLAAISDTLDRMHRVRSAERGEFVVWRRAAAATAAVPGR